MEAKTNNAAVKSIMSDYMALTGVHPLETTQRRYLWTDAFAVCNLLELYRQTNDRQWLDLALRLVDQVHHMLGRHRSDDPRSGWISGLSDAEGEAHPTLGGLRIGKRLNERGAGETQDEHLEWEQDGQYFHYLTKWMHALGRVSRITGDMVYADWAVELAQSAHAAFTVSRGGAGRMYWKMSIDLTRPLVPSMGQHDPLDGYVTYSELQALAEGLGLLPRSVLRTEIVAMAAICRGRDWVTDDPLGIGGLLSDAWRIAQLTDLGLFMDKLLLESVIDAALAGLAAFTESAPLRIPAAYRLPFRELGLAIGLKGVMPLRDWAEKSAQQTPLRRKIVTLTGFLPLAGEIEDFWLEGSNREAGTWREHREINMVMLATSLAPEGFLSI
jgi:hypothetical protein